MREAAVAGRVVGDHIVARLVADRVSGAGGAPVAGGGGGTAAFFLPERLFDGFGDRDVQPPRRARLGQRRRGGLLDRRSGLQPGLRSGQLGGQRVDRGGAGLDARLAGM
jgi:hypothetical protein